MLGVCACCTWICSVKSLTTINSRLVFYRQRGIAVLFKIKDGMECLMLDEEKFGPLITYNTMEECGELGNRTWVLSRRWEDAVNEIELPSYRRKTNCVKNERSLADFEVNLLCFILMKFVAEWEWYNLLLVWLAIDCKSKKHWRLGPSEVFRKQLRPALVMHRGFQLALEKYLALHVVYECQHLIDQELIAAT